MKLLLRNIMHVCEDNCAESWNSEDDTEKRVLLIKKKNL